MQEKQHSRPLIKRKALLEKFPGKGGWTFIRIPEVVVNPREHFGCLRVNALIDDFSLEWVLLQSMGNGKLFLPINANIRKLLKKEEGDEVYIILHEVSLSIAIPEELKLCLQDVPQVYERFVVLAEAEKRRKIAWIYNTKKEETKIDRINKLVDQLLLKVV